MKRTKRLDDRGIPPVMSSILVLTITVLLVGTAGSFFFGFTQRPVEPEQPRAVIEFEDSIGSGSDTVTIEHTSGERVLAANLYVELDGAECTGSGSPDGQYTVASDFDFPAEEIDSGMTTQVGRELGPGGTAVCAGAGNELDLTDATVTVGWENADGDSGTYAEWTQ
ncbi:type IV pilin N-terminal domain-containing protein [Salinibaculum salinum]|uniref:type IV pilin N-terminal domain-containing protein n=1 Tax=Salinibaculum salinum TaxID=3131996 RepID=UPI0030EE1FD4